MPIAREGRFLVNHDGPYGPQLGLETHQLAACVAEIHAQGYRAVFGSRHFGFTDTTLDVLAELPPLAALWFTDVRLRNVDGVYTQPELLSFGVHPKRPGIDFARLPRLEVLTLYHNVKDVGIASLSELKRLYLWHHNTPSKALDDVSLPGRIEHFDLTWANTETLDGLPPLCSLRSLEVHRCRNLRSLECLPTIAPALERLVVSACGRITETEAAKAVSQLPHLRHAFVQHRVFVSERVRSNESLQQTERHASG